MTQVTRFGSTLPILNKALGYDPDLVDDTEDTEPPPDLVDPDAFPAVVEVPFEVAGGTPTLVQSATGSSVNTTSFVTATFASPPTLGNLLTAVVEARANVSIVTPSGWSLVADVNNNTAPNGNHVAMYYKVAGAAEPSALTINETPAQYKRLVIAEWAGAGVLDSSTSLANQTAATTIAVGPVTPTGSVTALILAAFLKAVSDGSSNAFTPGTGYTELDDSKVNASFGPRYEVEYQLVASTSGSYTPDTTSTDNVKWAAILAIFTALPEDDAWTIAPEVTDSNDATYAEVPAATSNDSIMRVQLTDSYRIARIVLKIGASASGSRTIDVYGDNEADFSTEVLIATDTYSATGGYTLDTITFLPAGTTAYQYYRFASTDDVRIYTLEMYPPAEPVASDLTGFELKYEGGQSFIEAHGSMGAAETFDPTDGNVHTGVLDSNCTFTLSPPTGSGACIIELQLSQDGTGGWDITWPGSVTVVGTLDTTASTTSIVLLQTLDGGTSWTALVVGGGSGSSADAELNIEGGQSVISSHGAMGATETIDPTAGNVHTGTVNSDLVVTLGAPVGSGACSLELRFTNDNTGPHDVTFAGSVTVVGSIPTGDADQYALFAETLDAGSTWVVWVIGQDAVVASLDDLTDVEIVAPAEGDTLRYRSGTWVNEAGGGASASHFEVLMTGASPPEPLTTDDETDWIYGEVV